MGQLQVRSNERARRWRLGRSGALWVGLLAAAAFALAACGGGNGDDEASGGQTAATEPSSTETVFDAGAKPMDEGEVKEVAVRSEDAAPDFELTLFETENHSAGEILKLSDLTGRPVVVNFWFPSCPPCVAEMPDLEAAFNKHKADGVEFIGVQLIGLDSAADGQEFVNEVGVTYALGADVGSIIRDYKVTGFPSTIFLDSQHNTVRKWTGILDSAKIEELIGDLLN